MTDPSDHWPLPECPELRDLLLASYAQAHRSYHDTRHLAEVLERLDELLSQPEAEVADRDAVVLAAWFHDAVYDGERDDEERSAFLAEEELTAAGVSQPLVDEVSRLVRLTHEHRPETDDVNGKVLCDADLAILGADEQRYDEYVAGVRREFADLDEPTFRDGRVAVLHSLLEQPSVFHTELGRRTWEEAARSNVARELDLLGGGRRSASG